MISPPRTCSLFLVAFKALFPLFLVMGGCAPEMLSVWNKAGVWTEHFKKDNQTFVLLCFSHSANCEPETQLDQSTGAEVWLADLLIALLYWHYHFVFLFSLVMLGCDLLVFFRQIPEELSGLLCFIFIAQSLLFDRIDMVSNWNGQNI